MPPLQGLKEFTFSPSWVLRSHLRERELSMWETVPRVLATAHDTAWVTLGCTVMTFAPTPCTHPDSVAHPVLTCTERASGK